MLEDLFETQLREISESIEALPEDRRGALLALLEETRHRHQLIRQATEHARHALDDWRLIQKYLIFDHEARQRENRAKTDPNDDTSSD